MCNPAQTVQAKYRLPACGHFENLGVLKGCLNTYEGPCKDEDIVTVGSVVPAVVIVIMIFILPKTWTFWPFTSLKNSKSSDGLVNWITIEKKMPWGVMILLGGGFTLSYGCNKSGLSQWIGKKHDFKGRFIYFIECRSPSRHKRRFCI